MSMNFDMVVYYIAMLAMSRRKRVASRSRSGSNDGNGEVDGVFCLIGDLDGSWFRGPFEPHRFLPQP